MGESKTGDPFLDTRVEKYDEWLSRGKISCASRVVPVTESLAAKQGVLPTGHALEILRGSTSVAVQSCVCRSHYRRCEKPRDVCLVLDDVGNRLVARGLARHVTLDEGVDVLREANRHGLVHLSLYMPDHRVYALCSCCPCCCHDLQILKLRDRRDLIAHSEYVAATDLDLCVQCGACAERCVFGARVHSAETMGCRAERCLGCRLCVTVCPVRANSLGLRESAQG